MSLMGNGDGFLLYCDGAWRVGNVQRNTARYGVVYHFYGKAAESKGTAQIESVPALPIKGLNGGKDNGKRA